MIRPEGLTPEETERIWWAAKDLHYLVELIGDRATLTELHAEIMPPHDTDAEWRALVVKKRERGRNTDACLKTLGVPL